MPTHENLTATTFHNEDNEDNLPLSFREFSSQLSTRMRNTLYPVGELYLNSIHKRALDVVGSIILLPLAVPVVICAAAAIKLEDGGPVLFISEQRGQKGTKFGMFKMRSMLPDSAEVEETMGVEKFKKWLEDPRITNVGKIIRQWSIDELPQLINILRGEMSLVGNRPMSQDKINYLSTVPKVDGIYSKWLQIYEIAKPGAAGLVTSRGRSLFDQTPQGFRNRLRYETFYITHASLGFDAQLIFDTFKAVLSRHGAF